MRKYTTNYWGLRELTGWRIIAVKCRVTLGMKGWWERNDERQIMSDTERCSAGSDDSERVMKEVFEWT